MQQTTIREERFKRSLFAIDGALEVFGERFLLRHDSLFRREVTRAEMDELCERHGVALFQTSSAEDPESVGAAFPAAFKEGLALKVGSSSGCNFLLE